MILDFKQYFYTVEQELIIEANIDYSEPQSNNDGSDWDCYGGYRILSLEVFHENGEPYLCNNKDKNLLLDNEIRDNLSQQLRLLEIEDSRYDNLDIDNEFERTYYNIAED